MSQGEQRAQPVSSLPEPPAAAGTPATTLLTSVRAPRWTLALIALAAIRPLIFDYELISFAWLGWHIALAALLLGVTVVTWRRQQSLPAPRWPAWLGTAVWVLASVSVLRAVDGPAAWGWWIGWGGILALGWLLIIAGHQVAMAALSASMVAVAVLACGQGAFTLPALAGLAPDDPRLAGVAVETFRQRVAMGGWYGPFTIANALAIVMVTGLPVFIAATMLGLRQRRWAWAAIGSLVIAVLGVAFIGAGAKGAVVATGLAALWTWWQFRRDRWRWLAPPGLALLVLMLLMPWVAERFAPSVNVRVGYWRIALSLIAERPWIGHGFAGFSEANPAFMHPGDEPTRLVHSEVLEAAVSGGIPLALMVTAWLLAMTWRRRNPEPLLSPVVVPATTCATSALRIFPSAFCWLAVAVMITGAAWMSLGGDGGVAWWPGVNASDDVSARLAYGGWVVAIAVLMTGAAAWGWRAATMMRAAIPEWAITAGLSALALGCLIDFHLHQPALGAVMIMVVAVPGGNHVPSPSRWLLSASAHLRRTVLMGSAAGLGVIVAIGAVQVVAAVVGHEAAVQQINDPAIDTAAVIEITQRWPGDLAIASSAARRLNGADAEAVAEQLVAARPRSAAAHSLAAQILAGAGEWDQARSTALHAAGLSPTAVIRQLQLAELLQRMARAQPQRAAVILRERSAILEHSRRLNQLVHPADRVAGIPAQ